MDMIIPEIQSTWHTWLQLPRNASTPDPNIDSGEETFALTFITLFFLSIVIVAQPFFFFSGIISEDPPRGHRYGIEDDRVVHMPIEPARVGTKILVFVGNGLNLW